MSIGTRNRLYGIFLIILTVLLILTAAASLFLGTANISYTDVFRILLHHIPGLKEHITLDGIPESAVTIIVKLRLTRVILALLVGAGLAAVGSTMQCLFRNPMAEPGILGISSGAGLGATIAIVIGANTNFFGLGAAAIAAFISAMATIVIVYNISRTGNKMSPTVLILAGTAVSFMNSAVIQLIMVFRRDRMDYIMLWAMGSFTASGWNKIIILTPFLVAGLAVLMLYARQLNVISTGEETAQSLGIDVEKVKRILLAVCSLITAACVSTSGVIGFVGLIIPHVFRLITGPDQRVLIPYSVVGGATFLVICDSLARIIAPPAEIPVGAITAVFGSPFFIALLIRSKRGVM